MDKLWRFAWKARIGRQAVVAGVLMALAIATPGCERAAVKPKTTSAEGRQHHQVKGPIRLERMARVELHRSWKNPAIRRFDSAITFYLNFTNPAMGALMSAGAGLPVGINGKVELMRGIDGQALLLKNRPGQTWKKIIYQARGNLNLAKPGALAVWVMDYHWTKPGLWHYFLTGRDGGRFFMLAPTAVYMQGAGPKGANVVADWGMHWKTGQWHLLVLNWRMQSFALSLDGKPWGSTYEASLAGAKGPPGNLCIVRGSPAEKCAISDLMIFNRNLSMDEIRWLYHCGMASEKTK